MAPPAFTDLQARRYSRNILLREIGVKGQRRLLGAGVFVVGAGGLGSPALLYLAAAGVGRLGVADGDDVALSNLQRQIAHRIAAMGVNKALSAQQTLREINPECHVDAVAERLTATNIADIVKGYDVVLDGSDTFETRFLVSDYCWLAKLPLVSAAAIQFRGQLMSVLPGDGNPCYRCFVPESPADATPTCQEAGVLGPVVGVMGSLQAAEALKLLLGIGKDLSRHLLLHDALDGTFRRVKRVREPECPLCGPDPRITGLLDYRECCAPGAAGSRNCCCPGNNRKKCQ